MSVLLIIRLAALLLVIAGLAVGVWTALCVYRTLTRKQTKDPVVPESTASPTPNITEERRIILEMVRSGRITEAEGAALLDAADRKEAGRCVAAGPVSHMGLIVGTILCVAGFVMPWSYVHAFGDGPSGYQAGYHVGAIGWVILVAGLIPALLVCVPATSAAIDVPLCRIVVSGAGGALAGGLLVSLLSGHGDAGAGLFFTVAGFIVLFVSGIRARQRPKA